MRTLPTEEELTEAGFNSTKYSETILDLATGGGDNADLGGAVTDGVFVFSTGFDDNGTRVNKLYAGLLPDVDLGTKLAKPAQGAPTTAVWIGRVALQTFAGAGDNVELYASSNFELEIDFTDSTVDSTTEVSLDTNTATLVT